MRPGDVLKPLGVFVLIIVLIVGGAFVVPAVFGGGGGADGAAEDYSEQSPRQFQPDNAVPELAEEGGEIELDADAEDKEILIDTAHANRFERSDIEPLVETLVVNGHSVDVGSSGDATAPGSGGFGAVQAGYNSTLQGYDAVIVVQPTAEFTDSEIAGMRAYAEGGGRVLVLAEPTQTRMAGGGLAAQQAQVSTRVNGLTGEFGIHVSSDTLYNVDDENNDDNFKSIYAEPADGSLVEGIDRVNLDSAAAVTAIDGGDAQRVLAASDGTRALSSRRTGDYAVAARNGNVTVVGDSSFVSPAEIYDADNERLASNLLAFLVSGDKADDVPGTNGTDTGGFGGGGTGGGAVTPTPPGATPPPLPGVTPTPSYPTPTPPGGTPAQP